MSYGSVADRYARAVFELGVESNQLAELTEHITRFATVYAASSELRNVLDNPLVPPAEREAVLGEVLSRLGVGQTARDTVRLMAARRKLRAVPELARRLATLADQKAGIVRATVVSATRLPEAFYERLVSILEATTQKKIALERREDPALIAGVVTRIGDNTIDGSIQGRLAEIERQLTSF